MKPKIVFHLLALLFAVIALASVPVLMMEEDVELKKICLFMQVFWLFSLFCLVLGWNVDKYTRTKIVPKNQLDFV
jgi:uncharacterized membrane protein